MIGGVFGVFAIIATKMYRMVQKAALLEEHGNDVEV